MDANIWPHWQKSCSSSKSTLVIFFALLACACGIELQPRETYEQCTYPTGILSIAAERYFSHDEHVSLRNVAQCITQSAVLSHGTMVKPLSVAQARDVAMTQKYRSWQNLWESARLLHSLIGDWDAAAQAGSNENLFHAPLASCASTMERAVELVHSRHSASVEFGVRVVACDAAHSNTWKVLGVALFDAANHEDGMRALRAAQRLSPWHYEHVYAYIESLRAVGQRRQALVVARSALRLLPNAISLRCRALIVQRELCDWRGLWENIRAVQHSYLSAIELKAPCLTPFDALGLVAIDGNSQGISPADLRKISDYFSKQRLYLVTKSRQANLVVLPPLAFTIHTLNLGIASSLLQDNKIARYLQPALRFLNSAARHLAIQVMCFGLRLQAGASHARGREQFASACGTFVSLDTADDATVAEAINGHNLHVLVDLDGWNDGARQGVFARRPVALQIHIINYAGSTGSAWIDGFLGDVIATPPELTPHFTEKLMLLPQTYQLFSHASDRNMPLVDASDILLPPLSDGGVEDLAPLRAVKFLCASSPFRIDPDTFDLWMELMSKYPSSSLSIAASGGGIEALQSKASLYGVLPGRISKLAFISTDEKHLESKANFSVALDTRGFNGHSSLADVIWSGVPVVYLPIAQMFMAFSGPIMHTFDTLRRALAFHFKIGHVVQVTQASASTAGRIGAALLHALGEQSGIARTSSDYLDLARIFANGRALARKLQRKLKSLRVKRGGLYDTASWTMRFSKAIKMFYEAATSCSGRNCHVVLSEIDFSSIES